MLTGLGLPELVTAVEPVYRTAADLERVLRLPVTIVQAGSEIREVLRELSASQHVACWLDRRVDPSLPIALQMQQQPLQEVFDAVASEAGCVCCRLGDSLIVGRAEELDAWLTQAQELSHRLKQDRSIPANRRVLLARGATVEWQDLDEPAEVLQLLSKRWGLTISNPELLPHDLWAGGTLAGVDAVEAFSFVLGQFDLSFQWDTGGKSLTLIPLPTDVRLERTHRPKGVSLIAGIARIASRFPEVEVVEHGTSLLVRASVLQHAAIAIDLGEVVPSRKPAARTTRPGSRQFSKVQILRKSADDVLQALMAQGLEIEYDPVRLRSEGIDLSQRVTLDFESVSAEELMSAICLPLGLEYEVVGTRFLLRPKSKQ
ncbi:MAG: hypothetical protein ACK5Q5_10210 [Planctomycetaceae bacterium]